MNWRTFFKPTRGKGIAVIILIVLGFIVFNLLFGCGFSTKESMACSIVQSAPIVFLERIIIWPGISILTSTNDWMNSTRPLGQMSPYSGLKPLFWMLTIIVELLWLYIIISIIAYLFSLIRREGSGEQEVDRVSEASNVSNKIRKPFPTGLDICLIVIFIIGVIVMNVKINLPGPSSIIWAPLVIIFFYFFFKVFK